MAKWKVSLLAVILTIGSAAFFCHAAETETVETAPVREVVSDDMAAVYGTDIKDGVYNITVDSSSSMFNIVDCELTVKDGEMTALMTMGGTGYLYLFMGTGEEALAASEEEYLPFVETEEGVHTYTVPVEALDTGIDCAAFSKRRERWYDRTLVFRADSLPQDAFAEGAVTTVADLGLEDGSYLIEVSLEGGSGRASVESPAALTIDNGAATAIIVWGSPFYDYVIVGEEKLLPISAEGENSAYEIPVTAFDRTIGVTADTIAMSIPHEIEYTLYFDSSTIEKAE